MKAVAVLLILLGSLGLAYGGVSIWRRETILDVGPLRASREKKETLPIPPVAGGLAIAAGVVILLRSRTGA